MNLISRDMQSLNYFKSGYTRISVTEPTLVVADENYNESDLILNKSSIQPLFKKDNKFGIIDTLG